MRVPALSIFPISTQGHAGLFRAGCVAFGNWKVRQLKSLKMTSLGAFPLQMPTSSAVLCGNATVTNLISHPIYNKQTSISER